MRMTARIGAALLACLWLGAGAALASDAYPTRPIQIIVPFSAGGSIDITYRLLAPVLGKELGQSVVVVNKPGGAATIGMNDVVQAKPDGYTLGAMSFSQAADPALLKHMPYDPLKDLEPITIVSRSPSLLLVNPKQVPVKTVKEFIAFVKSKPPGSLNYSSVGVGSTGHLFAALLCSEAGIDMTHVPFVRNGYAAVAQGLNQVMFGPIPSAMSWVHSGKLRALAVSSPNPNPAVPDLPTVAATLPGFAAYEWPSLVAPKGTPKAIVDKIQKAVAKALTDPAIKKRLTALGAETVGSSPEELHALMVSQTKTWAKVIHDIGITPK